MYLKDTPDSGSDDTLDEPREPFSREDARAVVREYTEALMKEPGRVQEWLGEKDLMYGGLIAICVFMVQPFLVARSLDLSATISVVAFALAIPILAAFALLTRQEVFRRRFANAALVTVADVIGQSCAGVGVIAGFWHIYWVAGVVVLAGGLFGLVVYSVGYTSVEPSEGPRL